MIDWLPQVLRNSDARRASCSQVARGRERSRRLSQVLVVVGLSHARSWESWGPPHISGRTLRTKEVRPLVCALFYDSGAVRIVCVRCADLARVVLVPFGHSGACESPLDAFWCHAMRP